MKITRLRTLQIVGLTVLAGALGYTAWAAENTGHQVCPARLDQAFNSAAKNGNDQLSAGVAKQTIELSLTDGKKCSFILDPTIG